ncbi:MAG: NtaA/DmoA family FMN-dependent monooxygenase, partial [Gammaproteobacteria bacterium]
VTSLSQAEGQNFGYDDMLDHDQRYERAEEFLEVAYALWASWAEDALVVDRAAGIFAEPSRVRELAHAGEYFKVRGPLNVPRSPQHRPVVIQAGASPRGKDYAARWAEAVFEIEPSAERRRAYYADVKNRVANFGRDPNRVKILPAVVPFIGKTEAEARDKQAEHNELADPVSGLITLSMHTDHDFSRYPLDSLVSDVDAPGSQGLLSTVRSLSHKEQLTLRDIGKLYAQGITLPQLVGTASQVADMLQHGLEAEECDGFMISAAYTPLAFEEFVDGVVPELQRRGMFRQEYAGTTLRDHLGLGAPTLDPAPRRRR